MTSILIVEDDNAQAEALKLRLEHCGYLIAGIAGDGDIAVAQARALVPDVVLMDIVLPGKMDGIEAAQKIRECCDIPVLYLTAYADDEFFLRAKVTEPYAYLLKPSTSREIQLTIETALYRHKTERTAHMLQEKKLRECTAEFRHAQEELNISMAALQSTNRRADYSESRYKTLIEQAADAFFVFDLDGCFVEVNQQACDSLAYSNEELLQMCIADIAPGYDLAKARSRWLTYEVGKRYSVTASHRRKDGSIFPVDISLAVLQVEDKKLLMAAARNVTERQQAEKILAAAKQAEEANSLKNAFLGRMSHELRTPLNAILGFTQIMDASPDDETIDVHRENIKDIERSGWTLLRIIQDLLNLSEIEAGKVELNMENVHVYTCIDECWALLAPLAKGRMIKCNCAEDTFDDVSVWADPFRLKQIMTNLLANAIQYNRDGGSITVSGQHISGQLRILIADTGSGIPENELDSIFAPFSHVVERPYTIEGAGIGLSIAKQLTELMDGTIGVESFVGDGSIFWIEFPVAKIGKRIAP